MQFAHDAPPTDPGETLLYLARQAIAQTIGIDPTPPTFVMLDVSRPGAAFVTLFEKNGTVRGQSGSLKAWRSLREEVCSHARTAAFRNPHVRPLDAANLASLRIEVSILTSAHPLHFVNEADAMRQLKPGTDGIILTSGKHHATFLPTMWNQYPDPHEFMIYLKYKAGLPPNYWTQDLSLARYTARTWQD